MKKIVLVALMVMICVYTAFGQSEVNLDTAIQQASKAVSDSLSAGAKTALLNCGSGSNDFSKYVIDKMTTALDGGRKLTLIAGKDIDRIRDEMNYQLFSDINDTPALELGKKLGAWVVVTGSFIKSGNSYRYTVRVLDVGTKALLKSFSFNVRDDQQIRQLLGLKEAAVASTAPASAPVPAEPAPANAPVAAPAPAAPSTPVVSKPAPAPVPAAADTYKIGDTGPAGGLIFYDKGDNSDGWRYLEVSSKDAGTAQWGADGYKLGGTDIKVGTGKHNTDVIMYYLRGAGESGKAAQLARQYTQGGYTDWFLPSKEELNLIYLNLRLKLQGDFSMGWYWSSTEVDGGSTWAQQFSDGSFQSSGPWGRPTKGYTYSVRAVRQF